MAGALLLVSLLLNVVSSVGVIFVNKRLVFNSAGFHFATALTLVHFIVTFAGCIAFAKLRFFELKRLELTRVLSISFAFCGYVAFNNMSLLTNSVSVYQISKILTTPVIVAIETFMYQQRHNTATLVSLVPVCVGIFITVYTDSDLNWVGSFWAVLALLANAFYTVWGKTKQNELNVSPMQILAYQAPVSGVMLMVLLPLIDDWRALINFSFTPYVLFAVAVSCVFAFGVNFSFFLFVGQTSPLTMNVVGYFKTCLVFVGGFLFFDTTPTVQNVVGIIMTLLGVGLYSRAKAQPAPKPSEEDTEAV